MWRSIPRPSRLFQQRTAFCPSLRLPAGVCRPPRGYERGAPAFPTFRPLLSVASLSIQSAAPSDKSGISRLVRRKSSNVSNRKGRRGGGSYDNISSGRSSSSPKYEYTVPKVPPRLPQTLRYELLLGRKPLFKSFLTAEAYPEKASWSPFCYSATFSASSVSASFSTSSRPSASVASVASPRPYFLDYQSTTPVDPRVVDKMLPLYTELFGNPHSRSHGYGWEAEDFVEDARKQVAALINAPSPKNIIFTSGATEANNMAIKGAAGFYGKQMAKDGKTPKYRHIITTQIEHKCVLASCRNLQETKGWDVTYLPVRPDGIVDVETFKAAIRPDTLLVSVMHVNNEIGVVQPLEEIGAICRQHNLLFHTDAAQAVGKVEVDVEKMGVDLLSISGHKLYGPKGVGALFVRGKPRRVRLVPILDGGGQERGFRSGTLPAPIIVGFGEACRLGKEEMAADCEHVEQLYKQLYEGVLSRLPDVVLNGSEAKRYPGNVNLSFSCVEGESLLMSLKDIAVSSGSACTSESLEPSYVLRAIGVNEELAHTSLRFGMGRFTTKDEVDKCVATVTEHVQRLRGMSPLWELSQQAKEGGGEGEKMVWT